ncbi:MAG: hypothetical protein ABSG65_20855 [Bryobacteraceae bacterium]|jgi:hypothetical protein
MNLHKRFALTMACVTLLGLTAAAASAETITKATFTLPTQAYWNDVLLQPGDYTLSLERNLSGIELVSIRGEGVAARFVVPAGSADGSGHSYLMVDEVNGTNVIRELNAASIGRSYRFGVSKTVRNLTLRGDAAQPASIPVSGL